MNFDPIGVAGLGLLGRGIAACLLAHGFRVVGFTVGADTHQRARAYIDTAVQELIERANFPASLAQTWPERYIEAESLADFAPCRFVIESVLEDFAIKQQVFDEIEDVVREDVPIASNTSALPISLLQAQRKHPSRFLGMHWAEPAYATRFLELIRGDHTSERAFESALELGQLTGKEPAMVQRDVPGFIVNRLGYAMYREAMHLVETGVADIETIDRAFRNACGLWATLCGPFRWIDISGGPALYGKAMRGVLPSLNSSGELPPSMEQRVQNGERGVLNGRGFYEYGPEDASIWEKRLHDHVWAVYKLHQKYHPLAEE
jgi:3-hydroxybutyryl-CoA dehydrogenase